MNGLFLSRSAAGAPDTMHSARAMMMKNMDFRFISFTGRSRQGPVALRLGTRETFKKFRSYGDPLVTGSMGKREKEGKREENFQRGRKKRGEKEENY